MTSREKAGLSICLVIIAVSLVPVVAMTVAPLALFYGLAFMVGLGLFAGGGDGD